jgi:hypothetical protein
MSPLNGKIVEILLPRFAVVCLPERVYKFLQKDATVQGIGFQATVNVVV